MLDLPRPTPKSEKKVGQRSDRFKGQGYLRANSKGRLKTREQTESERRSMKDRRKIISDRRISASAEDRRKLVERRLAALYDAVLKS